MNLGETGVREERALFVGTISCGDVATARIRRKIKNVAIATGRENDCITRVRLDSSGHETARDDALRVPVVQNQVEHFRLRKHGDRAGRDLAGKRLIRAEEQLDRKSTRLNSSH